jgi:hypothetical protein
MNLRIPFAVTVVGALFVGGATTGTTLASWVDSESLAGTAVSSGTISLTANDSTTATFAAIDNLALNSGATPGTPQSFTVTLRNASVGKNLRMRMYVDDVTTTQADLNSGLQVSLAGAGSAGTCPSPTWQDLSSTNAVQVTATPLDPGATRTLCVSARVKGNAPGATGGKTGTLDFSFRGEQVQP